MNAVSAVLDNPFPGLRPYNRTQTLHGRDRDLILFKDRLYSARTTLLFAASGVGKSSFLQAKLVPVLEGENLVVSHARWGARAPLEGVRESWLGRLARYLADSPEERRRLLSGSAAADEPALRAALEEMWGSDTTLAGFASRFPELDTVLLLDQFEEPLNSLVHDPAVDALVEQLTELINATRLPLRVVFSMRQEFLAELSLFENRVPDLFANYYNLRHPTPEQAQTIISATATAGGAEVDLAGVQALVQDLQLVGGLQSGGETRPLRFVVPPVLQIVCSRMWSRDAVRLKGRELAFAAGYRAGGARELVEAFVEELIAALDDAGKLRLSRALDFLVSRQGGKIAYEVGVLAEHLQCARDELDATLGLLAREPDRVFRRIDRSDGTTWYELYHDAYAGALTAWRARFEAEQARLAEVGVVAAQKTSSRRTAIGCAAFALFLAVIVIGSTARDARESRHALAEAGDDYAKARTAYDALAGNWIKTLFGTFDADEELARFWDRRTDGTKLAGSRDRALVYALEALATRDTPERRRQITEIIGTDLSEIVETYHTSEPIVALSADGERYATLGRGGVVVSSLVEPGGAVLSIPGVEFVDVLLSDDGNAVWALGKRAAEGNVYQQKSASTDEPEYGLWTRRVDRPEESPRSWVGAEFGAALPDAWSISANGRAAVCAWSNSALRAFDERGAHDLGTAPYIERRPDDQRTSTTEAWQVALRPDGSAVAFGRRRTGPPNVPTPQGVELVECRLDPPDPTGKALPWGGDMPLRLRYSPDGASIAVATSSELHFVPAAQTTSDFVLPNNLTFGAGGTRLYVQIPHGLEAWNVATGKRERRVAQELVPAPSLANSSGDFSGTSWSCLARLSGDLATLRWLRWQATDEGGDSELPAPRARGAEVVEVAGGRTLRRIETTSADSPPWWLEAVDAALSIDGQRALVGDGAHYALLDFGANVAPLGPIEAEERTRMAFDFDAAGRRAFVLADRRIRELPGGAEVDGGSLESIRQLFVAAGLDALVVEAENRLWLLSTSTGGPPRSIAEADTEGILKAEAIDPTRRRLAAVRSSRSGECTLRVLDLATRTEVGETLLDGRPDTIECLALDTGGKRVAVVGSSSQGGSSECDVSVISFESTPPVARKVIGLGDVVPIAIAFVPDGCALVARTPDALLRIPLDGEDVKPRVRLLARTSVVREKTPNWFDAGDAHGERPRVLVLDAHGQLGLEHVRFDGTDVAPVSGGPATLRENWQGRLDLRIDGNGRAVPPLPGGGGKF